MFDFFKPRATCEELSVFLARRGLLLLYPGYNPDVDEEIQLIVEFGADEERIRSEITAFCCFASFRGMVKAFEAGAITDAQLKRLENAYTDELEQKVRLVSPDHIPSSEYDTFTDWFFARSQRYAIVADGATEVSDMISRLVDHFSDFACKGSPNDVLRLKFYLTFEKTAANTTKLITSHRLR